MEGVPIKFRAKDNWGKIVYVSYKDIDKETLVQLIGYDDEGNEVYEGDMIDAYIDGKIAYTFQAVLLNNFFVPKNMPDLKHIVRRTNNDFNLTREEK